MYTGFKPNLSASKSSVSFDPTETQLQSLQREVDNYTRKLEQEKRKCFGIQDSLKNVTQEYEKQKHRLNELKKENSKARNVMLQAKMKNLQANLDKAISTYDDTVGHNNKLKGQIDMLRREKKNYIQMQRSLQEQILRYQNQSNQKLALIEKKKKRAEELREEILQIRATNASERQQYLKRFDSLEKSYMNDKRERQTLRFEKAAKPESVDTQPLLKHRLKRIVASNKQKLRMIDQYKKHMKAIESAFCDIKAKSGIDSLEEITNTFIKSEEQNYSLYNYMDELSRNIDQLQSQNQDLQKKIEKRRKQNQARKQMLRGVTEEEKHRLEMQGYLKKKEQSAAQLNELIQKIKPSLQQVLIDLSKTRFNEDPTKAEDYLLSMNINDRTIQEYLSDLEKYINILMTVRQEAKTKLVNSIKDSTTPYSKPFPSVSYEEIGKDKVDAKEENNKFIDQAKFREYASEYWEKRRNKGKQA